MPRTFTLEEANALLPRLRDLLAEMQEGRGALERVNHELAEMARAASGDGHLLVARVSRKRQEAQGLTDRLNALQTELNELGCELKGLEEGLIDFPAERDGRTVYLCWKLGEERIGYWHDVEGGFAGRQPL
jgi:hypothetical protein